MQPQGFKQMLYTTLLGGTLVAMVAVPVHGKTLTMKMGKPIEYGVGTDLVNLLIDQAAESQELREAYTIIDRIQTGPACNQLAAYKLLTSCKSLEVGLDGTETPILLEQVKNLYAARLAVCELQSAHAKIPFQCKDIMSISLADLNGEDQSRLTRLWYGRDGPGTKILQPCLKALHEKPTSWTSYSNNRAQAITMCHSIREHLERQHTAETHRKLVNVISKVTNETSEVGKLLFETQQHHAASHQQVQELFNAFVADMHDEMEIFTQKGMQVVDLLSDVTFSVASLHTSLQSMNMTIKNASSDINTVRQSIIRILEPVVEATSEMSSNLIEMKDFLELAEPFLRTGAEIASLVNHVWQQLQATHAALLNSVPKICLTILALLVGRSIGFQMLKLCLVILLIWFSASTIEQVKCFFKQPVEITAQLLVKLLDLTSANIDIIKAVVSLVLVFTFALVVYCWIDYVRPSHQVHEIEWTQTPNTVRVQTVSGWVGEGSQAGDSNATTRKPFRRHNRRRNLAIHLGTLRHAHNKEADRFTRSQSAPLPYTGKPEWV